MSYFNKKSFWVLISCALLLRIFLIFMIPSEQGVRFRIEYMNDEPSHYNYIKFLAENHTFPVQTMTINNPLAFVKNEFEYYQPPLYYLLCTPFVFIAGEHYGFFLCRFFSFFLGVGTIILIIDILFKLHIKPICIAGMAVFISFLPTHAYFSSVVSNDSLCWFLSALLTLQLVTISHSFSEKRIVRWNSSIVHGFTLAAAMLTKSSMLVFFPITAAIFFWNGLTEKSLKPLVQGTTSLLLALILLSPWYIRSFASYNDIFAFNMGFGTANPAITNFLSFVHFIRRTIRSFWFPMQHLNNGTLPVILLELVGTGFVVMCIYGFLSMAWKTRQFTTAVLVVLGVFFLSCLAYIKLHLTWYNAEARFLFTGLSGILWMFSTPFTAAIPLKCNRYPLALLFYTTIALHPWLYLLFTYS